MVNKFDRERLAEIEQRLERAVTGEAYANPFIQSDLHACIRIIKDLEQHVEDLVDQLTSQEDELMLNASMGSAQVLTRWAAADRF
tara:strand:+ start:235 stop:489 length:255 start_codon:yes stop_codon:yes gene_type:complete